MIARTPWFARTFTFDLPAEAFPLVVERLRGTPARVAQRLRTLSRETRVSPPAEGWSIQRHAGHLIDLEPGWSGRVDDLLEGRERLREIDLTNRKTHEADHDVTRLEELIAVFREARREWVVRLDAVGDADVVRSAIHPRLEQPMRLLDLAFFVAEHDDHHLACITELIGARGN